MTQGTTVRTSVNDYWSVPKMLYSDLRKLFWSASNDVTGQYNFWRSEYDIFLSQSSAKATMCKNNRFKYIYDVIVCVKLHEKLSVPRETYVGLAPLSTNLHYLAMSLDVVQK